MGVDLLVVGRIAAVAVSLLTAHIATCASKPTRLTARVYGEIKRGYYSPKNWSSTTRNFDSQSEMEHLFEEKLQFLYIQAFNSLFSY